MTPSARPMITRCTSILANIDRTGHKMEKYRFVTDSSEPNSTRVDTMWVNQKNYNFINVEFAAIFTAPESLIIPEYIESFKFGIVSGKIQIDLRKVDRDGNWFVYLLTTSVELTFYSSTFRYQCLHAQYDYDIRAAPLYSLFELM